MPRLNEETGLKECSKCHEHKPAEMFYKNKLNLDGLHLQCKDCSKSNTYPNAGSKQIEDKQCSKCKIIKSVIDFTKSSKSSDGYKSQCRECDTSYKRNLNYKKNLDMDYKKCASCNLIKNVSDFNANIKSKDGYNFSCRECCNKKTIKYNRDESVLFKKCSCCGEIKSANDFYSDRSSKDGMSYHCSSCVKERTKRINSSDYGKVTSKTSYIKRMRNPIYSSKIRIRKLLSNIFMRNKLKKKSKTYEILNCDYFTFKQYIENQFKDGMSWDNFNEIHLDHIIPITMAKAENDIIILNHYTNLQPLFAKDNLEKHDRVLVEMIEKHFENHPDSPAYKFYLENIKGQQDE